MGSETSFRCGDCNESYPDAASLAEHRREGHKPAPLVAKPDTSAGKADSHHESEAATGAPSEPTEGKAEPDEVAARELVLFIENDGDLYRQQHTPIIKNLMRKRAKGVYDFEKSVKLFGYLADEGARRYTKLSSPGPNGAFGVFDKPTRMLAARSLAESFQAEADLGNYDGMAGKAEHGKAGWANKAVNAINHARDAAGVAALNAENPDAKEAWVDIATGLRRIYDQAKGTLQTHGKATDGCPNCGHTEAAEGKAEGGDFGIYTMGYNGERGRKVAARNTELEAMVEAERLAEEKGRGYMVWHTTGGHIGEAGKAMGCPGCGCSGARHNEGGCMDCDDCKLAVGRIQVRGKSEKVAIAALIYGDGALYGASTDANALSGSYWRSFTEHAEPGEAYAIVKAYVPDELALRLEGVGMNLNGGFRDGYEALDALAKADPSVREKLPRELGGTAKGDAMRTAGKADEPEAEGASKPIRAHFGKAGDFDPDSFHVAKDYEGRGFDAIFARPKGGKVDAEMMLQSIVFPAEGKFNAKTASEAARGFAKEFDLGDPVLE